MPRNAPSRPPLLANARLALVAPTLPLPMVPATPNTTLNLTAADYYVQPNEDVDITAVYSNPSYVASAVYLDSTSSASNASFVPLSTIWPASIRRA